MTRLVMAAVTLVALFGGAVLVGLLVRAFLWSAGL